MEQKRIHLLEEQPRAFCEGTVELINEEWIFFDKETDEAFPLEHFYSSEVHVFHKNSWKKGILLSNQLIQNKHWQYMLQDYDIVRFRKKLPYSFEQWLKEMNEQAFYQFITNLNELNFSVYDLIYCHNHLSYLLSPIKKGVNFMNFDNGEELVNVLHFFDYSTEQMDRFEFTVNTGKRSLVYGIKPPSNA